MRSPFRFSAARRPGANLALAVALAAGVAVGATGFAEPAFAQKKKEQKAPAKDYSKPFVAAYQPLAPQIEAEGADVAALKAQIPGLIAAISTSDDRMAAGNLIYSMGRKLSDNQLLLQGAEMMIESGKVAPEQLGQYNFMVSQLAYNLKDYAKARKFGEAALAAGYTQNNPQLLIAESYFGEQQYDQGLTYLTALINEKIAAGEQVPEEWVKRGLSQAYNNKLAAQALDYSKRYASLYPSSDSWGDAIAITRNFNKYDAPQLLDLLRLARRTNALRTEADYLDYIEAADARRLPGEVGAVIKEGLAAGKIKSGNMFVADATETSTARARTDRAELPALERDANAASAKLATVMAAGDAFLSYGQYDKAETLFTKALRMPGVDTGAALTRLGIAQLELGKTAEAKATFAKVTGARQPIAQLWTVYLDQKGS